MNLGEESGRQHETIDPLIVSRAVTVGLETAVKEMLRLMENYRGGN